MRLSKKIKEYRLEKGWTQYDLAKFSGVSLGSIKRYETDNGNITYANLEKIANALQKDISNFQNNKMSLSMSLSQDINLSPSQNKYVSKSQNLSPSKPLNTQNLKMSQNNISINIKEDTIYVPFFKDGAVSAGFGTEDFGNDCDFLPFKKQDLRLMFGAHSTANIGIIPCIGNSMQPTIEEGELVVFQQDNTQSEGAIYVVRFENELFVKRLKKSPLQLVSDNKEYEPISLGEFGEIEILGRVIGSYSINTKRF
ncbi:LexA family transcriptional regulator [Campylobacter fetus]|uniref:LexA family transcriptional regulator n=2 Tax=Campylobacter fetus TaxID=196 RepID=A0A5L4KDV2_CAMFE|nr:LexA family transcriptional regulator [Campylobacter fetus]EAI8859653.1 LexA family transcriptional regulator [Campylobacter fetus]EAJ5704944.1 LexA family transcriptional regulator [Campylobacter fetus]EAK0453731.1 LexA family transcriptional regulator [Campylobacter fetus]EAK5853224.1 LexA family transcriptional regulator [Campylobacter fetus]